MELEQWLLELENQIMQKLAAYLLERTDAMQLRRDRAAEAVRIRGEVERWLTSKGAMYTGSAGTYKPEDGSTGTFSIREASDGDRTWWMVDLREDTGQGRRFSVGVSVTAGVERVSVYVTLEAGWTTKQIMPGLVDPRCPRIVRDLIQLPGRWFHGGSLLSPLQSVTGLEAADHLVNEIERADRSIPIVTISTKGGHPALPELDRKLAYDLIGLANVCVLDDEASWALTDSLGRHWSCYSGAVRLYWPHFATTQDRFLHPLWTSERLHSIGTSHHETEDRFRRQLRGLIFRASALSVLKPREIDSIREAHDRRGFEDLRRQAHTAAQYHELANSYAADNDVLRSDLAGAREQIEDLQRQVRALQGDKLALTTHLASRGGMKRPEDDDDILPGGEESASGSEEPQPGETRYYKKIGARPMHDVMARVQDCGCNRWKNAHKADKAKKGISKLEGDRTDWQTVQHCAACTGGGMWRVRW